MARQIIDLPRIDLADLADDDILIIRDSSSRKDMRITVGDLKTKFYADMPDVTTVMIEDGAVTKAKIASKSIDKSKIDFEDLLNKGDWVLVGSSSLNSNSTGNAVLSVDIPTVAQGEGFEYKIIVGIEMTGGSATYPWLQVKTNDAWKSGSSDFAYMKKQDTDVPVGYQSNSVNPLAFEWRYQGSNNSCIAEVLIGRAGSGNFWNAVAIAGGLSGSNACSFNGGGRTNFSSALQGFRIYSSVSLTFLKHSHIAVFARKTTINGGLL